MNSVTVKQVSIGKFSGQEFTEVPDHVASEEPLEIRLEYGPAGQRTGRSLSVTMRTPGMDTDLVAGFLFTEGIIRTPSDVLGIDTPADNIATARLHPDLPFDMKKLERHFYTSSSCGVCGKTSIDAVKTAVCIRPGERQLRVRAETLYGLPETLRRAQATFDATGGLHASALFDASGRLISLREDVGRHNALDKLIGHHFMHGDLPLDERILLLSGRASFELLQKSAMAGLPLVCAVGAPSSLAVETAAAFGIALVGFLRDGRFNLYTGSNFVSFV
ncbi:MAG: formate dehydrogenase accessory sulfurtransferase FdhD [Lewinellaceae bacterium]|nr:formate dehydrogenase accessory sulfurtransferase FdhD [Lewinellaceae bacterium]